MKQENSKIKTIFVVLAVVWMAVIFIMSSRDADTSTRDSYKVGMLVGRIFVPGFSDMTEAEQLEFAEKVDHPIRKIAHASEYALLGILIFGAVSGVAEGLNGAVISWLSTTIYATTDEFHQLFVPGRSGQFSDICIDSGGAIVGVVIFLLFARVLKKRSNRVRSF